MAQLSRLKDAEIENGNQVNADDLDAEFDQLITGHNDLDTRVDDIENNAVTLAGVKTFSSIPVLPASNPTTVNQAVRQQYLLDFAPYQMQGLKVSYASASTITIVGGSALSSDFTTLIKLSSTLTVDITASGALGLDTGAEASNTWYYVYLIAKTDGTVSAVLSVTNENVTGSITLPTGYTLKRQLPIAVRNDGSSNFIEFYVGEGWPISPAIYYNVYFAAMTGSAGATNVVDGGTQTIFTDVDLSAYVPPISRIAILRAGLNHTAGTTGSYRKNGYTATDGFAINAGANSQLHNETFTIPTDSSQVIEYKVTAGSTDIAVHGYIVDQLPS